MSLTAEIAAGTDVGCVRPNNEDNFGYDRRYGVYVVCDGMGGQAAGEVASKMAVQSVLTYLRRGAQKEGSSASGGPPAGLSPRAAALGSAIQAANGAIHQAALANPVHAGMGSTIAAVLVNGRLYSIGHVGDSRIYLLRPDQGSIRQLTNDHSLVMEQVRRGLLTVEEAQNSEMQNIIIRALGTEETVQPDLDDHAAQPGDVLLLATDGLTRHVPDERVLQIVKDAPTLRSACDQLITAAKHAGGEDNITCLLLRFVDWPWFKKLFGMYPGEGRPWQDST